MRRGVIGAVVVAAVVIAVIVLREPPSPEPPHPPVPQPAAPQPEQALRVPVSGLNWREVALPADAELAHRSVVDVERAVFPVPGPNGTHRLISGQGAEIASGQGALTATVEGARLVVHEPDAGTVSTVDLAGGGPTGRVNGLKPGPVAAAAGAVVVQESDQCLTIMEAQALRLVTRHCAPEGWAISLLTAELDGVQWREATPGRHCARWFRLEPWFVPQVLTTGERACRAAVLVRTADWELTADFPPYEVGVLHPGPLVARRANREITLDTSALDVHACGGRIYWLSKPSRVEQQGELVRWTPGETRVEVLAVGSGSASPPRCVNGVLNVVTYGDQRPRLWMLADP